MQDVTYTIPGAEAVTYQWCAYDLVTGEDLGGTNPPTTYTEGESGTISASLLDAAARHEIRFWGRFNGIWSKVAMKNIIVNALGTLELPTVTFNGETVGDTLTLNMNEPMILNITSPEDSWICWDLDYVGETEKDNKWIAGTREENSSMTLDLSTFDDVNVGTYSLRLISYRPGYNQGVRTIELNVVNLEKCGENAYYTLEDGVLTIDGSGPMYDYPKDGSWAPWRWNSNDILKEVINGDITTLGNA